MIDLEKADHYYAAGAFNTTWEYLDKPKRSLEETMSMIHCCHTSMWHWLRTPDHTQDNVNIGLWQLSRVYAVAAQDTGNQDYAKLSRSYANDAMSHSQSQSLDPFYVGYSHEALARAAWVSGDVSVCEAHLAEARKLIAEIDDPESRNLLKSDLDQLMDAANAKEMAD